VVLDEPPLLALMEEDVVTSHKGTIHQNKTSFLLAGVGGLKNRIIVH
jgi:hypothetical protein